MPPNHLILCRPLLLLPSIFPSIWSFSKESVLHIRWLSPWWPVTEWQQDRVKFRKWGRRDFPSVPWLRIHLPMQVTQVQFLVRELRHHKPRSDWAPETQLEKPSQCTEEPVCRNKDPVQPKNKVCCPTQTSSRGFEDISFPAWRKRSFHLGQGQGWNTQVVTVGSGTMGEEQRRSDFPCLTGQGRGFHWERGSEWGVCPARLRRMCSIPKMFSLFRVNHRGQKLAEATVRLYLGIWTKYLPKALLIKQTVLRNQWWAWRHPRKGVTSKRKWWKLWTWLKSTVNVLRGKGSLEWAVLGLLSFCKLDTI